MVFLSRLIAALAYAGAAFLLGLILGERGELGVVQHVFTWVIPIAAGILILIAKQGNIEVMITGLALYAGLNLGQRAFAAAWDGCPAEVVPLRQAVIAHHARTGDYPARLEELGLELPCDCILRKTILRYNAGERGFRLWMTNDRQRREFGVRRSVSP